MSHFIIIETDAGLQVAGVEPNETPADAATRNGGVIIDASPYDSFEAAYDAMLQIPNDEKIRARLRDW